MAVLKAGSIVTLPKGVEVTLTDSTAIDYHWVIEIIKAIEKDLEYSSHMFYLRANRVNELLKKISPLSGELYLMNNKGKYIGTSGK